MGSAIAKALKEKLPCSLCVSEHDVSKHKFFNEIEVDVTDSNIDVCKDSDVVILAVKPQDFASIGIAGKLKGDAIIISIMAGVKVAVVRKILDGHKYIARVMPNLPALISEGISGFYAPFLNAGQKKIVVSVLKTLGDVVEVSDEDDINKITAISGSGPAYIFYFIKALRDSGVALGLSSEISYKLALKTALGASKYAALDTASLDELVKRVASKGGTTEKALQVFDNHDFAGIIDQVVKAAYKRAKELSNNTSVQSSLTVRQTLSS